MSHLTLLTLIHRIRSGDLENTIYEKIIQLKSGSLFGVACLLGAIASGAGSDVYNASLLYGSKAGEAYQMADDIQEIKHHMDMGSIGAQQMALLAPAFLYFAGDMRPHVLSVLRGENRDLDRNLLQYFRRTVRLMEEEIERRLHSAVDAFAGIPFRESYGNMIQTAPWELIRMFNRSPPSKTLTENLSKSA